MNNREITKKSTKNQFSTVLEQRKADARVKNAKEKKVLSPEKIAEKEAGYKAFLEKKAMRKRLRAKAHA
jgi:hypothetical protein